MERITVTANPNCRNCLGSGEATPLSTICGRVVCPCVTEQLRIVYTAKDYSIPENKRYVPGAPEYVRAEEESSGS